MKRYLFIIIISLFILTLLPAACSNNRTNVIGIAGTVKYIDLEGGFYGIVTDGGKNYDPINIEPEYKVDGLRVKVQGTPVTGQADIHQWGTLIKIIEIKEFTTSC